MKQFSIIIISIFSAFLSANAQDKVTTSGKWNDNCYVGINGGGAVPTRHHSWMSDLTPNFGIRLGKNVTPVLGFLIEGNAYFETACAGKGPDYHTKTFVDNLNVNFLASCNMSNLILGYNGEPRLVEFSLLGGFGLGHAFGKKQKLNLISSKVAVNAAFNFGENKEWQVYVEPSLNYGLQNFNGFTSADKFKYNINKSNFQVNVGVNYKFRNHDGAHNFKWIYVRDENEIKALNNRIHALREEIKNAQEQNRVILENKDAEIARLNEEIDDYKSKSGRIGQTNSDRSLKNVIFFDEGKTTLNDVQQRKLEAIALYLVSHPEASLMVNGYTSVNNESAELTSEKRAFAVLVALVKKYHVSIDRIDFQGLGCDKSKGDIVTFEKKVK